VEGEGGVRSVRAAFDRGGQVVDPETAASLFASADRAEEFGDGRQHDPLVVGVALHPYVAVEVVRVRQ
jgi:hypothetical protein